MSNSLPLLSYHQVGTTSVASPIQGSLFFPLGRLLDILTRSPGWYCSQPKRGTILKVRECTQVSVQHVDYLALWHSLQRQIRKLQLIT